MWPSWTCLHVCFAAEEADSKAPPSIAVQRALLTSAALQPSACSQCRWALTRAWPHVQELPATDGLGGFAYSLSEDPSHPGRLALGCGDNSIKLFSLPAQSQVPPTGAADAASPCHLDNSPKCHSRPVTCLMASKSESQDATTLPLLHCQPPIQQHVPSQCSCMLCACTHCQDRHEHSVLRTTCVCCAGSARGERAVARATGQGDQHSLAPCAARHPGLRLPDGPRPPRQRGQADHPPSQHDARWASAPPLLAAQ